MGLSPSKRVHSSLSSSNEFTSSCTTTFNSISNNSTLLHPYQLFHASSLLHSSLLLTLPLLPRFAPSPPSQLSVDTAFRKIIKGKSDYELGLDFEGFRGFGLELFTDEVIKGMRMEVARKVGIGAVVIAGAGKVVSAPAGVVGKVVGVYAAGVAATVVLGLG